jgi:Spy/CpxP family protein refolding chaperone
MHKPLMIIALLFITASLTYAKNKLSPYSGQEQREIKSLSTEEIDGYLTGQGMGFAKAGELNHYPGPKHVVDLAQELQLSEEQLLATREIYDTMHNDAVSIGELIVEKEKLLDELFARQKIDETQLDAISTEIGTLKGKLRATHLRAHLQMKKVLSSEQIERYDVLRGYGIDGGGEKHQHKHNIH